MDELELRKRVQGYEWKDMDFKAARRGVPGKAYETVSAYSNTDGGWVVFGVQENEGHQEIVGVIDVDKVQNDFVSTLRSGRKLSRIVEVREKLVEIEGKAILAFHIPEARRQDKPVYVGGDIRRSYVRRGASNARCTDGEVFRMLREAADERHGGGIVDLDPKRCFDGASLLWYRELLDERNPGRYPTGSSPVEFLQHWGLVVETGGVASPTRAAILLFGTEAAFQQLLPRPVVDFQWNYGNWTEEFAELRWADRLVIECNLVEAWKALFARYLQLAEKPFAIDPETMRRVDRPTDFIAFREAAINLLIHQDFADHARSPAVKHFRNRTKFWNPGDAFASTDEILDPGEKEVRNPRVVAAFRRIGLSEQAGTGMRAIFGNWRELGYAPPFVDSDRARKSFRLTLVKRPLLSQEQRAFQAGLGARLDEMEAKVLAYVVAHHKGAIRLHDARAVTGLSSVDSLKVMERLAGCGLVSAIGGAGAPIFTVAEHVRNRFDGSDGHGDRVRNPKRNLVSDQVRNRAGDLVSDQAPGRRNDMPAHGQEADWNLLSAVRVSASARKGIGREGDPAIDLSSRQCRVVEQCWAPRRLKEIMAALGASNRTHFKKRHLDPLIEAGIQTMTNRTHPNASNQRYVLTEFGSAIRARRVDENAQRSGSRPRDL